MADNYIYYWKNYLKTEKEFKLTPNSYVIHFVVVNQASNDIYSEWLSFPSDKELIGFIKNVALPSGYYSKLFGEKDGYIFITASSYDEANELLRNNTYKVDEKLINDFNEDYRIIEDIENSGLNMENINEFCNSYNSHLNGQDIVWSYIEIYENIKAVGLMLIKEYEEDGMIDQLENKLGMSKDQIIELFSNIDNNPFMMRRIKELLNNTIVI